MANSSDSTKVPLHNGVHVDAFFSDENGIPGDPVNVEFDVMKPDGSTATYTGGQLTHPATGHYRLDILDCDQHGPWRAVARGDGNIYAATFDAKWRVADSVFA